MSAAGVISDTGNFTVEAQEAINATTLIIVNNFIVLISLIFIFPTH
jgi:hypothetical protein